MKSYSMSFWIIKKIYKYWTQARIYNFIISSHSLAFAFSLCLFIFLQSKKSIHTIDCCFNLKYISIRITLYRSFPLLFLSCYSLIAFQFPLLLLKYQFYIQAAYRFSTKKIFVKMQKKKLKIIIRHVLSFLSLPLEKITKYVL